MYFATTFFYLVPKRWLRIFFYFKPCQVKDLCLKLVFNYTCIFLATKSPLRKTYIFLKVTMVVNTVYAQTNKKRNVIKIKMLNNQHFHFYWFSFLVLIIQFHFPNYFLAHQQWNDLTNWQTLFEKPQQFKQKEQINQMSLERLSLQFSAN